MTPQKALQMIVRDKLETGKFYVESDERIHNQWYVKVYYNREFYQLYIIDNELAYEVLMTKLSKGYTNYYEMAHDCQFDLNEKIKSFYAAALK